MVKDYLTEEEVSTMSLSEILGVDPDELETDLGDILDEDEEQLERLK